MVEILARDVSPSSDKAVIQRSVDHLHGQVRVEVSARDAFGDVALEQSPRLCASRPDPDLAKCLGNIGVSQRAGQETAKDFAAASQ